MRFCKEPPGPRHLVTAAVDTSAHASLGCPSAPLPCVLSCLEHPSSSPPLTTAPFVPFRAPRFPTEHPGSRWPLPCCILDRSPGGAAPWPFRTNLLRDLFVLLTSLSARVFRSGCFLLLAKRQFLLYFSRPTSLVLEPSRV